MDSSWPTLELVLSANQNHASARNLLRLHVLVVVICQVVSADEIRRVKRRVAFEILCEKTTAHRVSSQSEAPACFPPFRDVHVDLQLPGKLAVGNDARFQVKPLAENVECLLLDVHDVCPANSKSAMECGCNVFH